MRLCDHSARRGQKIEEEKKRKKTSPFAIFIEHIWYTGHYRCRRRRRLSPQSIAPAPSKTLHIFSLLSAVLNKFTGLDSP